MVTSCLISETARPRYHLFALWNYILGLTSSDKMSRTRGNRNGLPAWFRLRPTFGHFDDQTAIERTRQFVDYRITLGETAIEAENSPRNDDRELRSSDVRPRCIPETVDTVERFGDQKLDGRRNRSPLFLYFQHWHVYSVAGGSYWT